MYWLHHLLCGLSSGRHRGNGDPLSPRQGYFGPRSHGTRPQTQLGPRPLLPDETPGGQRRKEKNLTTDFTDYTDSEFGFGSWADGGRHAGEAVFWHTHRERTFAH